MARSNKIKEEEKVETELKVSHNTIVAAINNQIEAGEKLQATSVAIYDSPNPFRKDCRERPVDETAYEAFHSEYGKWNGFNQELIKRSFTNQGGEYLERYNRCGDVLLYSDINKVDFLKKLIKEEIGVLATIKVQVSMIPVSKNVVEEDKEELNNMKQVFVVYGHDKPFKLEIEKFLKDDLHLDVIALDEQPNQNRTIIEKFEHYSKNAGFAVILMSPDDTMEVDGQIYKQARQNVVLEMGYFMAKLGRANVTVILKGEVEKPSDISGILYLPFSGNWKYELHRELKAAGVEC